MLQRYENITAQIIYVFCPTTKLIAPREGLPENRQVFQEEETSEEGV
jgi:hypothetical protein